MSDGRGRPFSFIYYLFVRLLMEIGDFTQIPPRGAGSGAQRKRASAACVGSIPSVSLPKAGSTRVGHPCLILGKGGLAPVFVAKEGHPRKEHGTGLLCPDC